MKTKKKLFKLTRLQEMILLALKELGAVGEDSAVSYAEIALRVSEIVVREERERIKREGDGDVDNLDEELAFFTLNEVIGRMGRAEDAR